MDTRALSRANGFFRGNRFEFEARRFRKEQKHDDRHHSQTTVRYRIASQCDPVER